MIKEHEVFIAQMKQHGHKRMAYQAAFPGVEKSTAYAGAKRLLAIPEIAAQLENVPINTRRQQRRCLSAANMHFVKQFVKSANAVAAYKEAYPTATEAVAARGSKRLLENPLVQAELREFRDIMRTQALQEIKDELKAIMFSYNEKRGLLRDIALGHVNIKKQVKQGNEYVLVEAPVDMADRLRAIEIDNRMTGDNAPDKLQIRQTIDEMIITIDGNELR